MLKLRHLPFFVCLAIAGCDPYGGDNALGNLRIIVSTTGSVDADGYTLTVGGETPRAMASTDTTNFVGLPIGDYEVTLDDVEPGCSVTNGNPQTVYVPYGSKTLGLFVSCS